MTAPASAPGLGPDEPEDWFGRGSHRTDAQVLGQALERVRVGIGIMGMKTYWAMIEHVCVCRLQLPGHATVGHEASAGHPSSWEMARCIMK